MTVELPFEEVFADESAGNIKTPQSEYLPHGDFPVVDQGERQIAGYLNDESRICGQGRPAIIFGDHTKKIKYIDFPFCIGADGVKVLRPKIDADLKFLYHQLTTISLPNAGYSRHYKYLKRTRIFLPSINEQRRIAALLDKAESLRVKRQEAIAQLDRLAQAIFIEIFGDPATNPKNWPYKTLGEISTRFSDGPFGSNLKSEHYVDNGIRVIRLQNIGVSEFIDTDKAFISPTHFERLAKHKCEPEDIIIGTLGDPNLRACLLPSSVPFAINKADCIQMRVNKSLATPEYVVSLLNNPSVENLTHSLKHGQTRTRISMGSLRKFAVPVPELQYQMEFSKRISKILTVKQIHAKSLRHLGALSQSIQSLAFSGKP